MKRIILAAGVLLAVTLASTLIPAVPLATETPPAPAPAPLPVEEPTLAPPATEESASRVVEISVEAEVVPQTRQPVYRPRGLFRLRGRR